MDPNNKQQVTVSPINKLKQVMASPSVQEQFKNALAENSNLFVASLIDLYASDTYLQQCDPAQVVMEALKGFDNVAYIRFASVYRDFTEAKDFEEFASSITEAARPNK